jgi:O-antigen ligase
MTAVGGLAFVASPPSLKQEIIERFDPSKAEDMQDYSSGRLGIWRRGVALFLESPIFGHGQNSFVELSQLQNIGKVFTMHNDYLNCLVEFGIVGLILFLLVFYKIFQNMWQSLNTTASPWEKRLYISYIAGFCGYLTGMFFTNMGPARDLFWIYTAIVYKYSHLDKGQ